MPTSLTLNEDLTLNVPNDPIIPFIEGDGIGIDIWPAAQAVFDAAVEKTFGGSKKVEWKQVLAGQKAFDETGDWLPQDTIDAFQTHLVGIKGPLTTPVGGGIRSLNVAIRQILDLYVCLRPVKYFEGVPSPVKKPVPVSDAQPAGLRRYHRFLRPLFPFYRRPAGSERNHWLSYAAQRRIYANCLAKPDRKRRATNSDTTSIICRGGIL